jgi:hypothetical protein
MSYCIISNQITDYVGYLYREVPDNETDSGWRFLEGTESDDYINNADNLKLVELNDFLGTIKANWEIDIPKLRYWMYNIPYNYSIDLTLLKKNDYVLYKGEKYIYTVFFDSIVLEVTNGKQLNNPKVVNDGGYPSESHIHLSSLTFEEKLQITTMDKEPIIQECCF